MNQSSIFLLPRSRFRLRHSLSLRGLAFLLFLVYLIVYLIPTQVDIVSAVLGYSFLSLFVALVLATVFIGTWLRSRIAVVILGPDSGDAPLIESQRAYPFLVNIADAPIPPLFLLRMSVIFEHPEAPRFEYVLSGWSHRERFLKQSVTFPHRGEWECAYIDFSFEDQLGLSRFGWTRFPIGRGERVRVSPPHGTDGNFDIVSSRHRAGEDISESEERLGDPLDLKPYHPSDGMRRIVWKIFAKTGELVSRHPEPSMSPEGETVVFALASPADEKICSISLRYLSEALHQGLKFRFGCLGMTHRKPAKNYEQAENLLIDSVWDAYEVTQEDVSSELREFIDACSSGDFAVGRVVIMVGSSLLTSNEGTSFIARIGSELAAQQITPHFMFKRLAPEGAIFSEEISTLSNALFHQENDKTAYPDEFSEDFRDGFIGICERNGWPVIISTAARG